MMHAFALSDVGRVRARNEDACLVLLEAGLFAVADGMGGHAAGDVASQTAIAALAGAPPPAAMLRAALVAANDAVWRAAETDPALAGMGTTLTVLCIEGAAATIAHVGDSRLYRLRGAVLEQLTRDHTAAQEMIDRGQLTRQAAQRHALSSMLTRALGTRPLVEVDVVQTDTASGDRFLICSDGLTGMVGDEDLLAILLQQKPLDALCHELVGAANLRGGVDNITAVLVEIA